MSRHLKRSLIRLTILAAIAAACFVLTACDPSLTLNPKYTYTSFKLELGEAVPGDIEEYIDMSDLDAEERQFVKDNTEILYDGEPVRGQTYDDAGKHTLTIMYKGHQYRSYDIEILDLEAPVFTKSEDVYTFAGLTADEEEIDSMFAATDNSGSVKIHTSDMKVDYDTAGEYEIKATAVDPTGNKTEAKAKIIVQEPHYGAMGTYVFVSIADQYLTYFVDGEPVLDCPVVTGNAGNHSTPRGTFTIVNMARNVKLKGREDNGDKYESFVRYWMAFLGSEYGLHDADWRGAFGGDIYMGNGSHGCVNMPPYMAAELYGMVDIGTPVLIY